MTEISVQGATPKPIQGSNPRSRVRWRPPHVCGRRGRCFRAALRVPVLGAVPVDADLAGASRASTAPEPRPRLRLCLLAMLTLGHRTSAKSLSSASRHCFDTQKATTHCLYHCQRLPDLAPLLPLTGLTLLLPPSMLSGPYVSCRE